MLHKHFSEVLLLLTIICKGLRSSDIVQNISFANKALQEFLKNYDQIKKILESKDGLQNNSTSSESENSDATLHDKQNVEKKSLLSYQIETTSVRSDRPGTAGIYESHFSEDEDINSKQIANGATNKAKLPNNYTNKVKKQNNVKTNLDVVKDDTDSVKDSTEYDESEDAEEIPLDMPTKGGEVKLKQEIKKNIEKDNKKFISKKPKIFKNLLGEKTRFSIKHFRSHANKSDSLLENFRTPMKIGENSRRIKKIIYSEKFSPQNIWQEIISRPIKLKEDKDPFIRNDRLRHNNDKITIVIERGKATEDKNSFKRTSYFAIDSENTKLEYLRYGETCLQIPIKKCKKVIKAVKKRVCNERFKCKSELKSSFMEYGEKACKKEFVYTKPNSDKTTEENKHKIQPLDYRPKFRQQNDKDSFVDATRDRFFNKHYLRKNSELSETILRNDTFGSIQVKPISLRDRYERECQEENRKRCINACEYATEKTCSKHSCASNKSKAFKKSCKEECHRLFHLDKDSDSDSSDSDSDSDNSDSDSDSD